MSSMLLGERITNLMELQNTSKKQVCESLHIHPSTFSGYLSGQTSAKLRYSYAYGSLFQHDLRLSARLHTTTKFYAGPV